jgi:hypothetical protein
LGRHGRHHSDDEENLAFSDDVHMANAAPIDHWQPDTSFAGARRLRLTAKGASAVQARPGSSADTRSRNVGAASSTDASRAPVLIAGGDAATRGQVRDELAAVMPGGTRFEELGTFWQLLERAPRSRAVILSGDLDDVTAESLLHTLAHRHPDLPVVCVGSAATRTQ